MDDVAQAAWRKRKDPNDHPPRRALDVALKDLEDGKLKPKHVIVVYCYEEEDGGGTGWYQSGTLDHYGALGLLTRAAQVMGHEG